MTLEDLLKKHEGVRADTYLDSEGHPTVGVGHNLDAAPLPTGWATPLTSAQIDELLARDIAGTCREVRAQPWFAGLDPVRQAVLCDMSFNMGWAKLSQFHKMLSAVQAGNWTAAAAEMLDSSWARQVGARATEDAFLMLTGTVSGA